MSILNGKTIRVIHLLKKRNLTVASGDLPDAILDATYSDDDLQKLGKDGTIIPVEDLIDQYMPNFLKRY